MAKVDYWRALCDKDREIEYEITKIAMAGTNLVPRPGDMTELLGLARKLERLSDGRNRVVFDKLGRPGIYVVFPCDWSATQEWLSDSGRLWAKKESGAGYYSSLHPAFIINHKRIGELLVGKYQCVALRSSTGGFLDNYPVSLYMMDPAYSYNTQMFADLATVNAGSVSYGHDVGSMTLATWAYLALLQVRLGFESRGNDNQGRSSQKSDETGVKGGYLDPTSAGNVWHVKTGSGPMTWRHDGTPFGVSDLRGNVAEEVAGFRIYGGELQFIPDNDALTLSGTDLSSGSSSYWKAMVEDSADSLYVAPGTDGTVKIDFDEAETESNRRDRAGHYTKTIVNRQTVDSYSMSMFLSGLTAGEGLTLPRMMQMLLLAALDEDTPSGRIYLKNLADSDKRGRRGGHCGSGSNAGPAYLSGYYGPSIGYADYGSRPVLFNW